jgi:hypothetical protein
MTKRKLYLLKLYILIPINIDESKNLKYFICNLIRLGNLIQGLGVLAYFMLLRVFLAT